MTDNRLGAEWPEGAKPISTRQFKYEDLNQLRRIDYTYASSPPAAAGDDNQVSPFAAETENDDTRPIPEGPQTNVRWQAFDEPDPEHGRQGPSVGSASADAAGCLSELLVRRVARRDAPDDALARKLGAMGVL